MKPKVIIFDNIRELTTHASDLIAEEIEKKKGLVLGLPTGKTVIPLYKQLIKDHKKKKVDFSKTNIFNLDEYMGVNPNKKRSFQYFMHNSLFKKINVKQKNIHFLSSQIANIKRRAEEYEKEIKKAGGIDLQLLGLGVNGHIAFNEPGSPFNSRTREIILSHETKVSNFGRFHSILRAPKRAITMGLSTILEAKRIVLLATGKHKAKAVKAMVDGPVTTDCPASALKKHKDVLILLDKKSASLLKSKH